MRRAAVRVALALALVAFAVVGALSAPTSRFGGKFELVPLFGAHHRPLQRNGHSYYAVRNRITFLLDVDQELTVRAGQVTDLASIPRFLWPFLPPDGPWAEAAVFHDACYRTRGQVYGGFTRAQCDGVLLEAMTALGVDPFPRVIIWGAVRMFGGSGWGT
jgi:hypothetical protein